MAELRFLPLSGEHLTRRCNADQADGSQHYAPPEIDETSAAETAYGLWASRRVGVFAAPLDPAQEDEPWNDESPQLITLLKYRDEVGTPS